MERAYEKQLGSGLSRIMRIITDIFPSTATSRYLTDSKRPSSLCLQYSFSSVVSVLFEVQLGWDSFWGRVKLLRLRTQVSRTPIQLGHSKWNTPSQRQSAALEGITCDSARLRATQPPTVISDSELFSYHCDAGFRSGGE